MSDNSNLLEILNLTLNIKTQDLLISPIKNLNLNIKKKEIFGLVGESGSGKSLTALSILRLLPNNIYIQPGSAIKMDGTSLLKLPEKQMRLIRKKKIGYIFQDPMSALNPVKTIYQQLIECALDRKKSHQKIIELLEFVRIPDVKLCLKSYPHQLSGGMKQRVMIAMALTRNPDLLIADEPTTALDVTTQAQVLTLIKSLKNEFGMSVLLITHDLAIVSQIADRLAVMHKGEIVETQTPNTLFAHPKNVYTKKLLSALPDNMQRLNMTPKQSKNSILLEVANLSVSYKSKKIIESMNLKLFKGSTLCVVGESGCGKSTLAKTIMRLVKPVSGEINYKDLNISSFKNQSLKKYRHEVQMIFQDPYSSMNPRMRINEILCEGLDALNLFTDESERKKHIEVILKEVELESTHLNQFPHEFSGGQRQRISIARALAVRPQLIICDEPTSSLDVSIQAQILKFLMNIQNQYGISYLFITHNFGVVKLIADHVAIMYSGQIVEYGPCHRVLNSACHPYTQILLAAVPTIKGDQKGSAIDEEKLTHSSQNKKGCHFAPRCPHAFSACQIEPPTIAIDETHHVKCHLYNN